MCFLNEVMRMKKSKKCIVLLVLVLVVVNMKDYFFIQRVNAKDDEPSSEVKIVTEETCTPLDRNQFEGMKNAKMGDHEEEANIPTFFSANHDGPHWENRNGKQTFVDGKGNVVYHEGSKKVIDVSEHNGKIDWNKVKQSGIDGVILRVGWGWLGEDQQFAYNIKECNRLHIPYGIYLYSYAYDANFAYHEAEGTIEMLKKHDVHLSYPIYYDIEAFAPWNDNGVTRKHPTRASEYEEIIATYINRMNQEAEYKDKVHVYSYRSYVKDELNSPKIHQYVSWVAEYGDTLQFSNRHYNGEEGWQYTSDGSVNGINGRVDLNCFSDQFYDVEASLALEQEAKQLLQKQKFNVKDSYLSGIKIGTKISTLKEALSTLGEVIAYDKNNQVIQSAVVATGQQLVIKANNGKDQCTFSIVIRGDVNGDGKISAIDYVKIRNKLDGKKGLYGSEFQGADVNLDQKISAIDYVKIRNQLDGKKAIEQQ